MKILEINWKSQETGNRVEVLGSMEGSIGAGDFRIQVKLPDPTLG